MLSQHQREALLTVLVMVGVMFIYSGDFLYSMSGLVQRVAAATSNQTIAQLQR